MHIIIIIIIIIIVIIIIIIIIIIVIIIIITIIIKAKVDLDVTDQIKKINVYRYDNIMLLLISLHSSICQFMAESVVDQCICKPENLKLKYKSSTWALT